MPCISSSACNTSRSFIQTILTPPHDAIEAPLFLEVLSDTFLCLRLLGQYIHQFVSVLPHSHHTMLFTTSGISYTDNTSIAFSVFLQGYFGIILPTSSSFTPLSITHIYLSHVGVLKGHFKALPYHSTTRTKSSLLRFYARHV